MRRWLFALLAACLASPAFAQKDPAAALATMTAGDGLKVELFASEPMLINPTSIDVDHKGRVWVAEAVNYRRKPPYNRPMLRKEGDRIVVLTDKDGDGKADDSTVFYQSEELYGPLSVLVIPQANPVRKGGGDSLRVLVAQSPDILEFTDADGDLKADGPPKKFLTGFQGVDHDHGVHGMHLGPDGKLYFTVGDSGVKDLQSSDGKGKKWTSNTTDVQKGTVWRCDLDGKNLELIAHNFRNNYEACVDSFGEIWLSDNDDDGNQQTRICFVMPGGNYGYGPRGPGQTHWHEEQPGIVHKTLRTGFGSPTGIQFYEGSLLPKQYANTLMHCDAGPREVRAFTRKPKGAGYELDKANMLTSSDNWFRPSDVCTAPDGSVFVSDWYDPGVGGHGMGDWTRGRIYRLTPKEHKGYTVPEVKLDMKEGVLAAIGSPCLCTRSIGIAHFREMKAEDASRFNYETLAKFPTPELTVRVMWNAPSGGSPPPDELKADLMKTLQQFTADPRFFAMDARLAEKNTDAKEALVKIKTILALTRQLRVQTPRPMAELLTAMRKQDVTDIHDYFYAFAKLYDGSDIFYRAALNIACGTDPVRRDAILADFEKHFPEWNDKVADLVWELRPKSMLPKLEKLMGDSKLTAAQKARIVDILAVNDDLAAGKTLLTLVHGDAAAEVKAKAVDNLKLFLPTKWNALTKSDEMKAAVGDLLKNSSTTATGLQLISAANFTSALDDVVKLASDKATPAATRLEAIRTLGKLKDVKAVEALMAVGSPETELSIPCVRALGEHLPRGDKGNAAETKALEALQRAITTPPGKATAALKSAALAALAGSRGGTIWLLQLKEKKEFPADLDGEAGRLLRNSPFQGERNKAMILFPPAGKLDPTKLPAVAELAKKKGNAENGKALMAKSLTGEAQCLKCHTVRGVGGSIGPDLSMIGKKGSKENLYDSLLTPSKAIADQYVSWRLDSDDGQSVTGLLVEETPAKITVRDANGKDYTFNPKDVRKQKDTKSIMPEDVIKAFSEDELIDVVEYLMTLQTPSFTPDSWLVAGPFPAKGDTDLDAKFDPETKPLGEVKWKTVRGDSKGYFDLAAFHGKGSPNSVSYLHRVIESPADQEVMILLGTDDGCRLWVNGEKAFGHERHDAATPGKDAVKVKLKRGNNTLLLKVNNGNDPHGFYFTIEGGADLKLGK
jgi:putative membrane-bound dehydrogenase-like protein